MRKEIRKILNEVAGKDYYRTEVKSGNVECYDFKEIKFAGDQRDLDVMFSNFIVIWDLDMEARSWGIKSIGASIVAVGGSIIVEDFDSGETVHEEKIDVSNVSSEWKIENKMEVVNGTLYPTSIEIVYKTKTIIVS